MLYTATDSDVAENTGVGTRLVERHPKPIVMFEYLLHRYMEYMQLSSGGVKIGSEGVISCVTYGTTAYTIALD